MNNSVLSRFDGCSNLDRIRAIVTVRPKPLAGLSLMHSHIAAETIFYALKEIFIPNDFSLEFIKEMVDMAQLHSKRMFGTEESYVDKIYNPPEAEVTPVCLTGLAGIGKSQTIAALMKVMPEPTDSPYDHFNGPLSIRSYWHASARGKGTGKQMLSGFLGGDAARGPTAASLLNDCRRQANMYVISLIILDETQHVSTGQGAAKVTDILLTLTAIGPPMVYACNYSLGHKLKKRNSEDKQRLLADPRVMLPDEPDSHAWQDYIQECMSVCNGHLKIDAAVLAEELYRATFGIKRLVVRLLKIAYLEARSAGRFDVVLADVDQAYASTAYSVSRGEVEELHRMAIQGGSSGRLDLLCPFDLPKQPRSNVVSFSSADRHHRVVTKVLHSSLTVQERAAKQGMADVVPGLAAEPVKPKRLPRLPKPTTDDMIRNFEQFKTKSDSSAKPRRPK